MNPPITAPAWMLVILGIVWLGSIDPWAMCESAFSDRSLFSECGLAGHRVVSIPQ